MGGYITIPPVKEKRWDVISGYIKLFNFQIGAELGVADAVNFFRPILYQRFLLIDASFSCRLYFLPALEAGR